jgi:hypothetical protein
MGAAMIPSAYFRQHGPVEAPAIDERRFRPYWRRRARLDALLAKRSISDLEYRRAVEFRDLFERAETCGFVSSSSTSGSGGGDRSITMARAIDAAAAVRAIRTAIGVRLFWFLCMIAVEDLSFAQIAKRRRIDPKTARARALLAIRRLAGYASREANQIKILASIPDCG